MQLFAFCVAILPLAVYLLVLGWINLRPWPLVVSGSRETAALGLALAGCVLVGPGRLLVPPAATQHFAAWIWLLLALLYTLGVTLVILVARPRLVIYNVDPARLRSVLSELAVELDPGAHWAGDSLALHGLGIELRVESFAALCNVSLVANGDHQSATAWHRLEQSLGKALANAQASRGPRAFVLIALGLLPLVWLAYRVAQDPAAATQGLHDLLGR